MSITESPVMHTAEHAVNSASIGRMQVCDGDETGNMKRPAPSRIALRKPNTISHLFFMDSPCPRPSPWRRDGPRSTLP